MFLPRHTFPKYNVLLNNFKGHQHTTLKKFNDYIKQTQYIIELRDLRIPLSSRNPIFEVFYRQHKCLNKRLILYTRGDIFKSASTNSRWNTTRNNPKANALVARNKTKYETLLKKLNEIHGSEEPFMILDCRDMKEVSRKLIPFLQYQYDQLENGLQSYLPLGYRVLVCGIPNVGKSTLINTLRSLSNKDPGSKNSSVHLNKKRRSNVCKTGDYSGVTKKISEIIKINEYKNGIYLFDTPGISMPVKSMGCEKMLGLSLCNESKSSWDIIDPVVKADYFLYVLNLMNETYFPKDNFKSNDIFEVLNRFAIEKKLISSANNKISNNYKHSSKSYKSEHQDENQLANQWLSYCLKTLKIQPLTYDVDLTVLDRDLYNTLLEKELQKLDPAFVQNILLKRGGDSSISGSTSSTTTTKGKSTSVKSIPSNKSNSVINSLFKNT